MAAGRGRRLGSPLPKAFVTIGGRPLLCHALDRALACPDVAALVVVAPPADMAQARTLIGGVLEERAAAGGLDPDRVPVQVVPVQVVPGGLTRTESVARGLTALSPDVGLVLVHDAARALTPPGLFAAVVAAVRHGHGAVVPGLAVRDTIKQIDDRGHVVATPPRSSLRAVQTPQGFLRETLQHAHEWARINRSAGAQMTDDAALVEAVGGTVTVVDGDPRAFKVTTADDVDLAEWWLTRDPR